MKKILVLLNSDTDLQRVTATAMNISKATSAILYAIIINHGPVIAEFDNCDPDSSSLKRNNIDGNKIAGKDVLVFRKTIYRL